MAHLGGDPLNVGSAFPSSGKGDFFQNLLSKQPAVLPSKPQSKQVQTFQRQQALQAKMQANKRVAEKNLPPATPGRVVNAFLKPPLSLLGTSPAMIQQAYSHPIARLQNKGAFAPQQMVEVAPGKYVPGIGSMVPFFGGPEKNALNEIKNAVSTGEEAAQVVRKTIRLPKPELAAKGKIPSFAGSDAEAIAEIKAGRKPATLLGADSVETAKRAGLRVKDISVPDPGVPGDTFTYHLAAKSQAKLDALEQAILAGKGAEVETAQEAAAIGRALGYPERDIAFYIEHNKLPSDPTVMLEKRIGGSSATSPAKVTYGRGGVPRIPKGKTTIETGGEAGRLLRGAISGRGAFEGMGKYEKVGAKMDNPNLGKSVKALRAEQDVIQAEEKAKRIAASIDAAQKAPTGSEAYFAAISKLKGELPKLHWGAFEEFSPESVAAMHDHIWKPATRLRHYERIRASAALNKAAEGVLPARNEIDLLQKVFGREVANNVVASVPTTAHLKALGFGIWNMPRSLMASVDLSAPLRQGLVAGARHPIMFAKEFGPMIKAFGSEEYYQNILNSIYEDPLYEAARKAGLSITDLAQMQGREEQFMYSDLAERLTGGTKYSPVRMSGRAYTGFLDKMRFDMFKAYVAAAQEDSRSLLGAKIPGRSLTGPEGEKLMKDIARAVNEMTGRGQLPSVLAEHAVTLNSIFFSPRLLASRLNLLFNPVMYLQMDPFARKQAVRGMLQMLGTLSMTLYLAKLAGAQVGTNPTSSDFAKIKFGETRIDTLGGFQQPMRLVAQLAEGKVTSTTSGQVYPLSWHQQGPYGKTYLGQVGNFVTSKFGPTFSLPWQLAFEGGKDAQGNPITVQSAAYQRMVPLLMQDIIDAQRQYGSIPASIGLAIPGTFGVGLQTYQPKPPKGGASDPLNVGGGGVGGNPLNVP